MMSSSSCWARPTPPLQVPCSFGTAVISRPSCCWLRDPDYGTPVTAQPVLGGAASGPHRDLVGLRVLRLFDAATGGPIRSRSPADAGHGTVGAASGRKGRHPPCHRPWLPVCCGRLIVLRPGATQPWPCHSALAGALAGAVSAIAVRKLGRSERTVILDRGWPMLGNFM